MGPKLGEKALFVARIEGRYLYDVLRYVEAIPLRAKLVSRAEDWPWSSLSTAAVRDGLVEVARPKLAAWNRDGRWVEAVNETLSPASLNRT